VVMKMSCILTVKMLGHCPIVLPDATTGGAKQTELGISLSFCIFFLSFFLVGLGFELRALALQSRSSTA
jgi:hypothetical protein